MNIIDPRGMELLEWCDEMTSNLASFVPPFKISEESEFQDWGAHILRLLRFRGINVPDPYQFTDWKDWAERLNQVIAEL